MILDFSFSVSLSPNLSLFWGLCLTWGFAWTSKVPCYFSDSLGLTIGDMGLGLRNQACQYIFATMQTP